MSSFDENHLQNLILCAFDEGSFESKSCQTDSDKRTFIIGSENQYRIARHRQKEEGGEKILLTSAFVIDVVFFFFCFYTSGESHRTYAVYCKPLRHVDFPPTPTPIPFLLVTIVKDIEFIEGA